MLGVVFFQGFEKVAQLKNGGYGKAEGHDTGEHGIEEGKIAGEDIPAEQARQHADEGKGDKVSIWLALFHRGDLLGM